MGIGNDDGTHELYLANVFVDGVSGASYRGVDTAAEVGITHDAHGRMLPDNRWEWRSAREVVGFAVMCDCSVPGGYGQATTTVLAHWKRVYSRADEDLDLGRLYVALADDTAGASDRPQVEAAMRWHWSKHLAPEVTTRQLEAAWAQSRTALAAVEAAVKASRGAGLSWADVGRATGMSRQAARQRWAAMPFEDPSYDPNDPGPEPDRDAEDGTEREQLRRTLISPVGSCTPEDLEHQRQAAEEDWQMRVDEQQWREENGQ